MRFYQELTLLVQRFNGVYNDSNDVKSAASKKSASGKKGGSQQGAFSKAVFYRMVAALGTKYGFNIKAQYMKELRQWWCKGLRDARARIRE